MRFVPYPVVGGFLAGTGWLLFKGGIYVASGIEVHLRTIGLMLYSEALKHTLTALAFGLILLFAVRFVKKPLVIPIVLGVGLVVFAIGMLVTGSSIDTAKDGGWLLGPFETARLWQPWTFRALGGADWSAVLGQAAAIATAVLVAAIAILFNISGTEVVLHRDLDTNRELRDAGFLNVISGALGGIPGYHALSLTALAERMSVDARAAGLVATLVPVAAVVFGAGVIELIPRMIVGGVLVFLGLSFIVEWVWDKRRTLPKLEYVVVLVILTGIIAKGFLPGVVIGLVLAVVLFAINYGRTELVHEVAFGPTYHSNVDRPPGERDALRALGPRVQILRVSGYVFFGMVSGLLERIRMRVERWNAAVPRGRPAARDRHRFVGGAGVPQGGADRRGERLRAGAHGRAGAGDDAAGAGRRGRGGRRRPVRARPRSRAAGVRGRAARRCAASRRGPMTRSPACRRG